MKWTLQRCQAEPAKTVSIAEIRPVCASEIDQDDPLVRDEEETPRVRFNARLVAMRGKTGQPILLQEDSPYAGIAVRAVGARLLRGGSGGPFSLVDGSAIKVSER